MAGFNARTYGRKSSLKRKQEALATQVEEAQAQVKKRRKVEVEVVVGLEDVDESPAQRPKVRITHGSPQRNSFTKIRTPSPSPPSKRKPPIARDLSELFDATISPTTSPRSPARVAKRMLARSKTDSTLETPTRNHKHAGFDRTPSLPTFLPSSPSKVASSSPQAPKLDPLLPLPILPTLPTTRTYAGKSRSFLVSVPASSSTALALASNHHAHAQGVLDEDEDDYSMRESYTSLRTRWGVDNSEDDPYPAISPTHSNSTSPGGTPPRNGKGKAKASIVIQAPPLPNGMMNPLKSITELRSKGESRRFLDEVGYLFEGMDKNGGIGLRRASALEITTKLCDTEFTRKAKAADFLSRTWDVLGEAGAGRDEDKILDTLLILFAALVARDPSSLADLALRSSTASSSKGSSSSVRDQTPNQLIETLFSLLLIPCTSGIDPLRLVSPKQKAGDAELKKAGIARKDRGMLTTIYNTISTKAFLFPSDTLITTPLLISQVLQTLPPSLLNPTRHLPPLLTSLKSELERLSSRTDAPFFVAGADEDADASSASYESVLNHLRLLDVFLLGQWGAASKPDPAGGSEERDEKQKISGGRWQWDKKAKRKGKKGRNGKENTVDPGREGWLIDALVTLGIVAELRCSLSATRKRMNNREDLARRCMEMTLRVLVSLTHADEGWCRKFLEREGAVALVGRVILAGLGTGVPNEKGKEKAGLKIEDEDVKMMDDTEEDCDSNSDVASWEVQKLDRLCLSLGLLTNLVQVVEEAKDALRGTLLDPSCSLKKRSCIQKCICLNPISVLDILIRLYIHQDRHSSLAHPPAKHEPQADLLRPSDPANHDLSPDAELNAAVAADASFLRGHLAVLFGLLMRRNWDNREVILAALPSIGGGGERGKFTRLVDQAKEFVSFYAVLSGGSLLEEGDEGETREGGDGKIARDVVRFLEELRDGCAV